MAIKIQNFIVLLILCSFFLEASFTEHNVTSYLYTMNEPSVPFIIEPLELFRPNFYPITTESKVFIIIHGWLQSVEEFFIFDIRNLLFRKYGTNTIIFEINWWNIAKNDYVEAKKYSVIVANSTSDIIFSLVDLYKVPHENIEIISYCMGCHIAAIAGKNIQHITKKKIGKIIALDPAGPSYYETETSKKLCSSDADVVYVIHTDAFMFGYGEKCGTIDIFPNGGKSPQPGCLEEHGVIEYNTCSHLRSILLYIESLNNTNFCGIECPTFIEYKQGLCSTNRKINFAKPFNKKLTGTYFCVTNAKKPFLGKKRT